MYYKLGFEAEDNNFVINEYHDKNNVSDEFPTDWESLDCEYGRILTTKGVYTCPFLANDHRGRCGSDFKDFSRKNVLETSFCSTCLKNQEQ